MARLVVQAPHCQLCLPLDLSQSHVIRFGWFRIVVLSPVIPEALGSNDSKNHFVSHGLFFPEMNHCLNLPLTNETWSGKWVCERSSFFSHLSFSVWWCIFPLPWIPALDVLEVLTWCRLDTKTGSCKKRSKENQRLTNRTQSIQCYTNSASLQRACAQHHPKGGARAPLDVDPKLQDGADSRNLGDVLARFANLFA